MHAGVGRQLDVGLFPGFRLAGSRRRAPAGRCELCSQPEPVLLTHSLPRNRRRHVALAGSDGKRLLRSERPGPDITRLVPRSASLANSHFLRERARGRMTKAQRHHIINPVRHRTLHFGICPIARKNEGMKGEAAMADITNLLDRIDKEFTALEDKLKTGLKEKVEAGKERQQRLEIFNKTLDDLKAIWGPRLDALVKRFGKKVEVTPRFIPATREATFEFQSKLARIRLKFSVSADRDIQNIVLAYDLEIVPSFMEYERHSETTFPVAAVDKNALTKWVDDRIVGFVRTYLSLH